MPDDYIYVDNVVPTVLDNGWLDPEDVAGYIEEQSIQNPEFLKEIKRLLKKLNWKEIEVKCMMRKVEKGRRAGLR